MASVKFMGDTTNMRYKCNFPQEEHQKPSPLVRLGYVNAITLFALMCGASLWLCIGKYQSLHWEKPSLRIDCPTLNRADFDSLVPDFIFGAATSSYQVEGAANEDGRGPSIWDSFTHNHPEKITDRSNGDVAIDEYHRYKEDVEIIKNMSMEVYRFSISWSRVLPNGTGQPNPKGIEYYNNLINEILKKGMKPYVTLFHWDLPQALQEKYGGFLSPLIVDDFKAYVELCYKEFGDRVLYWVTANEPYTVSNHGYAIGVHAPGRCSYWYDQTCLGGNSAIEPYLVTHHQLLAHVAAVKLYKDKYQACQKGVIGITVNTYWFVPTSKAKHDIDAAFRALDFMFGWQVFMDPLISGDYPHSMRSLVGKRLPKFTDEESKLLKGSYDFIGINYYSARYASAYPVDYKIPTPPSYMTDAYVNVTTEFNGVPIGPQAASDWLYIYPKGLYDLILYTKEKYNNPIMYITENGVDEFNNNKIPLQIALKDPDRSYYYYQHLCYLQAAIKEGANVQGYLAWSILDNFEWNSGYTVRFGINYVDYANGLKRYPKDSMQWFQNFLKRS
ncbi:unnamed protein product [Prunus brigantina]